MARRGPPRKTKSQRLIDRLNAECADEVGRPIALWAKIERTYASYREKCMGAWTWSISIPWPNSINQIGSSWTVTELLKAKTLTVYVDRQGSIDVFPDQVEKEGAEVGG